MLCTRVEPSCELSDCWKSLYIGQTFCNFTQSDWTCWTLRQYLTMTNKHQLLAHTDPTVGVCWRLLKNVGVWRGSVQAALEGAFSGKAWICEKSLVITFISTLRTSSDLNSWRSWIFSDVGLPKSVRKHFRRHFRKCSIFFFFSVFKKIIILEIDREGLRDRHVDRDRQVGDLCFRVSNGG